MRLVPHSNEESKQEGSFEKHWFVLMDLDAKPDGSFALLCYDDEARRLPAARPRTHRDGGREGVQSTRGCGATALCARHTP